MGILDVVAIVCVVLSLCGLVSWAWYVPILWWLLFVLAWSICRAVFS